MTPSILALLAALSAALVAVFGKIGLSGIDSTLATTVRGVIMAAFLVAIAFLSGKLSAEGLSVIPEKAWFFIVLSAIAGALSWLFYFAALQGGTTSVVAALDKLSIVFVVLFAALFLSEGFSWQVLVGSVLMAGGAMLIAFK